MEKIVEILKSSFMIWNKLSEQEQNKLINNAKIIHHKKGDIIHKGDFSCIGLVIISKGSLRAYLNNENGKQITLYKLLSNDLCLFSAACIMKNIDFEVYVECV